MNKGIGLALKGYGLGAEEVVLRLSAVLVEVAFVVVLRVVVVGVVVWASMPGAFGASARSARTFLVPDTEVEVDVVLAGEDVFVGVVCACRSVEQASKLASRKGVFMRAR
ncbi:hypothetical protein BXP70_07735 [Hymenobacter crusticola]|uniref:Uncharacterized protein n=1 Tax=Hymenobacter crusticola TaxID=1770526 RepID=A0A243WFW6_9BACT|nr:hypothetical protein BXP70_07735 [Hymenobacter crusticola]